MPLAKSSTSTATRASRSPRSSYRRVRSSASNATWPSSKLRSEQPGQARCAAIEHGRSGGQALDPVGNDVDAFGMRDFAAEWWHLLRLADAGIAQHALDDG